MVNHKSTAVTSKSFSAKHISYIGKKFTMQLNILEKIDSKEIMSLEYIIVSQELEKPVIIQPSQITEEDLIKLKQEVKEKTDLLECLENHRADELKLLELIKIWKLGGAEVAEILAIKLDSAQTIKDLLIKLGIPIKMFLDKD